MVSLSAWVLVGPRAYWKAVWLHDCIAAETAVLNFCILLESSEIWLDAVHHSPWWRHQMETFSTLLAICAGNSPVTGESPAQRPVTRSFDVFFDLRLNKRLSKRSWGWWIGTLSSPLWRHCNAPKGAPRTGPKWTHFKHLLSTLLKISPQHFDTLGV